MKKILTVLGTISIFALTALAQAQNKEAENKVVLADKKDDEASNDVDWHLLGKHNGSEYLLKKDSLMVLTFEAGQALRITMQTNSDKGLFYNNLFFWVNSCKQMQGELTYFSLDQKASKTSMVVLGGSDIGSKAATIMCKDYEYNNKHLITLTEQEKKENEDWKDIAATDKLITSLKRGTQKIVVDSDNPKQKNIEISGRVIDLTSKKVSLQRWFTDIEGCKNETGVMHIHDLSTNSYSFNNYSFHSGSLASLIAEDLCKKLDTAKDETK